jgi:hypothetical protein
MKLRLVSDEDRLWTGRLLEGLTDAHFKERLPRLLGAAGEGGGAMSDTDLMAGLRGLMFGDFLNTPAGSGVTRRHWALMDCDRAQLRPRLRAAPRVGCGTQVGDELMMPQVVAFSN